MINKVRFALAQQLEVDIQDSQQSLVIAVRMPAHMRRDDDVPLLPKRVVSRQWFRVRNVESGAADPALVERGDQVIGHDGRSAPDIGDVRLPRREKLELRGAEHALRLRGERHGDDEEVEPAAEKLGELGRRGA